MAPKAQATEKVQIQPKTWVYVTYHRKPKPAYIHHIHNGMAYVSLGSEEGPLRQYPLDAVTLDTKAGVDAAEQHSQLNMAAAHVNMAMWLIRKVGDVDMAQRAFDAAVKACRDYAR